MRTISNGQPSTLATYRTLALIMGGFKEDSVQVQFIDKKIAESPNGENEEVLADERQMLLLFTSMNRPTVKLVGEDGNVFNIIGKVYRALQKAKQNERAEEFKNRAMSSESYDAVLILVHEYVDVE